jgi:hypothetical protein
MSMGSQDKPRRIVITDCTYICTTHFYGKLLNALKSQISIRTKMFLSIICVVQTLKDGRRGMPPRIPSNPPLKPPPPKPYVFSMPPSAVQGWRDSNKEAIVDGKAAPSAPRAGAGLAAVSAAVFSFFSGFTTSCSCDSKHSHIFFLLLSTNLNSFQI